VRLLFILLLGLHLSAAPAGDGFAHRAQLNHVAWETFYRLYMGCPAYGKTAGVTQAFAVQCDIASRQFDFPSYTRARNAAKLLFDFKDSQ